MGIQSHLMQNRRMQVRDIVPILHGVEPQFIGGAMNDAALGAASGQDAGEAVWMMIPASAGGVFKKVRARRATKFRAYDHEGVIQHAPLFEISD